MGAGCRSPGGALPPARQRAVQPSRSGTPHQRCDLNGAAVKEDCMRISGMRVQMSDHMLRPRDPEALSSMHGWARWVFVMLLGSFFGRAFFYIGIPPAKIFVSEIVLVLFLVLRPRELCDRWMNALTSGSVFGPFAWLLLLSILYGSFEVLYGLYSGYSALTALENLAFNIYPVYFFLALWIGAAHPTMLQKAVRGWAWMLAIYGPTSHCFLNNIKLTMPGASDVRVFGQ